MIANVKKVLGRLALVAVVAGSAACDGITDDDHDLAEAEGMVVVDEATNQTLVTVNAQRQVTGSLGVRAGQERALEVHFTDARGRRIEADEDEYSVGYTVANSGIARISEHDGHLDLRGVAAGSTTAEFRLVHGAHDDYRSPAITITVAP